MVPLALFFSWDPAGRLPGMGKGLDDCPSLVGYEREGWSPVREGLTDDYSKEARGTSLWMPHDSDKRTSRRRTYLYAVLFGILECGCVTGGVNGGG